MFIDRSICLASYNVFGEGDGSQLPQIHVVRAPESKREATSYYHSFELYFDHQWDSASLWDFKEYIEED